jgi:hypothetical protein
VFDRYDITDERDIQGDGERLARYLAERAKLAEERAEREKVRTKVRTVSEGDKLEHPGNRLPIQ